MFNRKDSSCSTLFHKATVAKEFREMAHLSLGLFTSQIEGKHKQAQRHKRHHSKLFDQKVNKLRMKLRKDHETSILFVSQNWFNME